MLNPITIVENLLKSNSLHEVTFNNITTHLFESQNLEKEQAAFIGHGYWKESWVVIGKESLNNDPFIIDSALPGFPVLTAMLGEELTDGKKSWEASIVSPSFENFLASLKLVDQYSKKKAPSEKEETHILDKLEDLNEDNECYFWEDWIIDNTDEED
jgi:hypothetical protein